MCPCRRSMGHHPVQDHLTSTHRGCRHALLIDPVEQSPEIAADRAQTAVICGTQLILIGGSTDTSGGSVDATVRSIKERFELCKFADSQSIDGNEERWEVPIVLFPSGADSLSDVADGVLFMRLMNSTDPKFIIGEQVIGAPFIAESGNEAIGTGYIVCEPGGAVGEVGSADLITASQSARVRAYALAASMFGFKMLYLEAGSGATSPVPPSHIEISQTVPGLTIMVGGGIRTPSTVRAMVQAGAQWIVTGTMSEEAGDLDQMERDLTAVIEAIEEASIVIPDNGVRGPTG